MVIKFTPQYVEAFGEVVQDAMKGDTVNHTVARLFGELDDPALYDARYELWQLQMVFERVLALAKYEPKGHKTDQHLSLKTRMLNLFEELYSAFGTDVLELHVPKHMWDVLIMYNAPTDGIVEIPCFKCVLRVSKLEVE